MVERMSQAANEHPQPDPLRRRLLNQMARELLLAQSSDWAFIMKTGTHTQYAENRTKDHLNRFEKLWQEANKNSIDIHDLQRIESMDNIFPDIDYRVYSSNLR